MKVSGVLQNAVVEDRGRGTQPLCEQTRGKDVSHAVANFATDRLTSPVQENAHVSLPRRITCKCTSLERNIQAVVSLTKIAVHWYTAAAKLYLDDVAPILHVQLPLGHVPPRDHGVVCRERVPGDGDGRAAPAHSLPQFFASPSLQPLFLHCLCGRSSIIT